MAKYVIRFLDEEEKEVEADLVRKYRGGWEFIRKKDAMESVLKGESSEEIVYTVTAKSILDWEKVEDS